MHYRLSKDKILFNIIAYTFLMAFTVCCLLPFLFVLSGALSSERSILEHGYSLFPREFSLSAFRTLLAMPGDILNAYGVTVTITVLGTAVGLDVYKRQVYISVRPERYSYQMIRESGEFGINLTTEKLAWATDFCGVKSGKDVDKWEKCRLTRGKPARISAVSYTHLS